MAREPRQTAVGLLWINSKTNTEWDEDGCNYFGINKKGEHVKPNNAESSLLKKGTDKTSKKEKICPKCNGMGVVDSFNGSYGQNGACHSEIPCPKCFGKGTVLE